VRTIRLSENLPKIAKNKVVKLSKRNKNPSWFEYLPHYGDLR